MDYFTKFLHRVNLVKLQRSQQKDRMEYLFLPIPAFGEISCFKFKRILYYAIVSL